MSDGRRPLVAGNWKMNKTAAEAREFCTALASLLGPDPPADVVVCPPFTALEAVVVALGSSPIAVYAQAVHGAAGGPHTGEISADMLRATGVVGTLVGHSERRAARETDEQVAQSLRAGLDAGLMVVLCCGESLGTRRGGGTERWVAAQVASALAAVHPGDGDRLVIAYEPIWAIGTGETASPAEAQEACAIVRAVASERVDGAALRVLYGGSVTPANAAALMAQPDVDGVLVGGASLEPGSFARIVAAAG